MLYDWDFPCHAAIIGDLKLAWNWMKTRPDSLVQLKSGRDSHWRFRIRQLFCHTSGSERRHLKPDYACIQNNSCGTSAYHQNSPFTYFFFLTVFYQLQGSFCCSSFPASLEAGLSQMGDTRIPLPCKSLGHSQKSVVCKVGLCTSLRTVAENSA